MNNRNALVCGSSKGIGASTAIELSKLGVSITLLARDEDSLANVFDDLSTSDNQNHNVIIADFDNPVELKEKIDEYVKENPPIHILINNSGGPKPGPIIDANIEDFIAAFNRHLICNHILVQALVPKMKEENFGRIINITSTSVKQPIIGLGVSNTIRAAVAAWSKTLSLEVENDGVTINNVLPGFTNTSRLNEIIKSKSENSGLSIDDVIMNLKNKVPLNRFAEPKEVAKLILYLASKDAGYINGVSIPIDGGRLKTI